MTSTPDVTVGGLARWTVMEGMDSTDGRWLDDLDRPPAPAPAQVRIGPTVQQTVQALGLAFVLLSAVLVLVAPLVGAFAGPLMAGSLAVATGYVLARTAPELEGVVALGLLALLLSLLPFL
ncbi:hypothetical protein [Nocardioides nanhaiensis]|uniref:AI-2E family transporter n=1 Tax=Nocardioides nanhaiensis TaxID=1476871 RepID=A0ABP8WHX3_9ACTN